MDATSMVAIRIESLIDDFVETIHISGSEVEEPALALASCDILTLLDAKLAPEVVVNKIFKDNTCSREGLFSIELRTFAMSLSILVDPIQLDVLTERMVEEYRRNDVFYNTKLIPTKTMLLVIHEVHRRLRDELKRTYRRK